MMTLMVIMAEKSGYNWSQVVTAGHTWSQLVKLVTVKDPKNIYFDVIMVTAVHIWSLSWSRTPTMVSSMVILLPKLIFTCEHSYASQWIIIGPVRACVRPSVQI